MGLVPEFFILMGIGIFLGMSLLSALLNEDIPRSVQWLFQGAAAIGLGQMFASRAFINSNVFPRDPGDPTRFWISLLYLAAAVSNVIGLNVYLAAVRRKTSLASIFSGTVTVPIIMFSAVFVSSFIGSGGQVSFTPATIVILAAAVLVVGLSVFGFLREAFKHLSGSPSGQGSSPMGPVTMPPEGPGIGLPLQIHSMRGEEWEESPAKEEGQE